jgi:hypothetical protein
MFKKKQMSYISVYLLQKAQKNFFLCFYTANMRFYTAKYAKNNASVPVFKLVLVLGRLLVVSKLYRYANSLFRVF